MIKEIIQIFIPIIVISVIFLAVFSGLLILFGLGNTDSMILTIFVIITLGVPLVMFVKGAIKVYRLAIDRGMTKKKASLYVFLCLLLIILPIPLMWGFQYLFVFLGSLFIR